MTQSLWLLFYITISLISCGLIVRLYRTASLAQRRQMIVVGIGALAIPLFILLVCVYR